MGLGLFGCRDACHLEKPGQSAVAAKFLLLRLDDPVRVPTTVENIAPPVDM